MKAREQGDEAVEIFEACQRRCSRFRIVGGHGASPANLTVMSASKKVAQISCRTDVVCPLFSYARNVMSRKTVMPARSSATLGSRLLPVQNQLRYLLNAR